MVRCIVPVFLLTACGAPLTPEAPGPGAPEPAPEAPAPDARPAASPAAQPAAAPQEPWARRGVPEGPDFALARRGLELATDTHRLLPDNVGDALNCTNCHLEEAQRPKAAPWVGVTDRYPKYRKRSGKVDDLQDRINGCFERSMNGTPLARDSEPMLALVAYMAFLSEGVEDGKALEGIGMPRIQPPEEPDPARGEAIYIAKCSACHQVSGAGVMGPDDKTMFPPLWGERSYNIGAGMARLDTAAAFVKWNMPHGQGGSLTDQEAYDVASYFIFQDRPDFAGKDKDWPKGGKPRDARY